LSGSQLRGFPVFPELSNSGSPPAQPGDYSGEFKNFRRLSYLFLIITDLTFAPAGSFIPWDAIRFSSPVPGK
jgi:hypothetical protein